MGLLVQGLRRAYTGPFSGGSARSGRAAAPDAPRGHLRFGVGDHERPLAAAGLRAGELPSWPLRESASGDEKLVARITAILGFDEAQYEQLQDEVWDLTFSPPFRRAFIASETLLHRHWVIGRQGIAIVKWQRSRVEKRKPSGSWS